MPLDLQNCLDVADKKGIRLKQPNCTAHNLYDRYLGAPTPNYRTFILLNIHFPSKMWQTTERGYPL